MLAYLEIRKAVSKDEGKIKHLNQKDQQKK